MDRLIVVFGLLALSCDASPPTQPTSSEPFVLTEPVKEEPREEIEEPDKWEPEMVEKSVPLVDVEVIERPEDSSIYLYFQFSEEDFENLGFDGQMIFCVPHPIAQNGEIAVRLNQDEFSRAGDVTLLLDHNPAGYSLTARVEKVEGGDLYERTWVSGRFKQYWDDVIESGGTELTLMISVDGQHYSKFPFKVRSVRLQGDWNHLEPPVLNVVHPKVVQ